MWQRLRQAVRFRQLIAGATGLLFGILLNVLTNALSSLGALFVPVTAIILILFVVLLVVNVWLWLHQPGRVGLNLQPPKTLRTDAEKQREARQGLVTFVSLYRPLEGSAAKSLKVEEWQRAARENNYQALDFPHSNLGQTIEAIASHASRLKHCWLIGTTSADPDRPSSQLYIPALVAYLHGKRGIQCDFHHGPQYEITLDDDALVFTKTLELMRQVFAEAQGHGLGSRDLIADFTSGIRSLSLGMILACLDGDRDIELIGSHYGSDGNLIGAPFPIVFRFEPVFEQT